MSHVATIDLIIKNMDALKRTCEDLGLTLKENQKTYRWFGKWVQDYHAEDAAYKNGIDPKDYGRCEHAVEVPGSNYDIGIIKNPKGDGYVTVFDFYGSGQAIHQKLGGPGLDKFRQHYAASATELEMANAGYYTEREWLPDGSLNVYVSEGAQ